MRKEINTNIILLALLSVVFLFAVILLVIPKTRAWIMENEHIDVDSNLIYSINQGYGDDLVSLNNLSRIYQSSDESVTQVTFIPGDQIYYTFVFKIATRDYVASTTTYDVSLVLRAEALASANGNDGDYLTFLHDCMIEQNSCKFAVLHRGTAENGDDTVTYYDIVKYSYNNGTYTIDENGDISTFDSTTTGALVTNTPVTSFCPAKTDVSIAADFSLNVPIVPISNDLIVNESGDSFIFFMLYVPILYVDTGVLQNEQMDSTMTINGSTILLSN